MVQRTVNKTISYELTIATQKMDASLEDKAAQVFRLKLMSLQAPQVGRHWSQVLSPERSFIKEVLTNGNLIGTLQCE